MGGVWGLETSGNQILKGSVCKRVKLYFICEAIRIHWGILNKSDTLGLEMVLELCGLEAAKPACRETGHSAHPGET